MLPKNTILGTLTILEIYEFYNMPVLFACKNRTGQLYIAVWVEESANANFWLYTPLSPERFATLRQGQIDLHEAFIQPEDIFVFKVTVPKHISQSATAEAIHSENLDTEWAPLPGDYLDLPSSLPQIVWEDVDQRLLAHV